MSDATCSGDDCDRPVFVRGLCSRHYDQAQYRHKKYGTPFPPKPPRRLPEVVSVYALLEPGTREPRYVGHSADPARRLKEHWRRRAYAPYVEDNPKFSAWLRSLNGPPELRILQVVPYEDRFEAERRHTGLLRQLPGVDLLNIYAGAEVPDVTRTKMSASHRGTKASPGSGAKISASLKAYHAQRPADEKAEMLGRLQRGHAEWRRRAG